MHLFTRVWTNFERRLQIIHTVRLVLSNEHSETYPHTARLLAQPVRTCKFTNTPLPKSLLLRFHVLKDPAPPHSLTYLPLSLYQSSRRRNEPSLDLTNSPLSSGLSFVLRAPVLAALQTIEYRRRRRDRRAGKSLPTIAPHTLTTV